MVRKLKVTLAASLLLAVFAAPVVAQDTTLTVSRWSGDSADAQSQLMEQFTEETGIEVALDAVDWTQLKQKQVLSLSGDTGQYDLVMVHDTWLNEYVDAGYLHPVDEYLGDAALTGADLDLEDFASSMIEGGTVDGQFYGVPTNPAAPLLAYDKEVLEAEGIAPPADWTELVAAAQHFAEQGTGIALPAQQAGAPVEIWAGLMRALGGDYFTADGQLNVNSPEAIQAAQMWKELNQYALEGSNNWHWADTNRALQLGDAPLGIVLSGIAADLENPENSRVVGKVGYSVVPPPAGSDPASAISFFTWGVPENSEHKEEAFMLSTWLTSKEQLARLNKDIMLEISARASIAEDPEIAAQLPFLPALTEAFAGGGTLPNDVNAPVVNDRIGSALSAIVVNDADPQAELEAAQAELAPLYQ